MQQSNKKTTNSLVLLIILLPLRYNIDKHASVFALFADEPRKFIHDRKDKHCRMSYIRIPTSVGVWL